MKPKEEKYFAILLLCGLVIAGHFVLRFGFFPGFLSKFIPEFVFIVFRYLAWLSFGMILSFFVYAGCKLHEMVKDAALEHLAMNLHPNEVPYDQIWEDYQTKLENRFPEAFSAEEIAYHEERKRELPELPTRPISPVG